jgi:hypothetical protein
MSSQQMQFAASTKAANQDEFRREPKRQEDNDHQRQNQKLIVPGA